MVILSKYYDEVKMGNIFIFKLNEKKKQINGRGGGISPVSQLHVNACLLGILNVFQDTEMGQMVQPLETAAFRWRFLASLKADRVVLHLCKA